VENHALAVALEKTSEEYRKVFLGLLEHLRPQRLKMVNKALAIANQQPYKEARQFIRGYYLALDRGTLNEATASCKMRCGTSLAGWTTRKAWKSGHRRCCRNRLRGLFYFDGTKYLT